MYWTLEVALRQCGPGADFACAGALRLLERPATAMRPPTKDQEWAEYLRGSHDPDDRSLAMRLRLVERLKQRQRLNPSEEEPFQLLQRVNAVELDYLKEVQRVGYAVADERPCWPRLNWPTELEELFQRTN